MIDATCQIWFSLARFFVLVVKMVVTLVGLVSVLVMVFDLVQAVLIWIVSEKIFVEVEREIVALARVVLVVIVMAHAIVVVLICVVFFFEV